MELRIEQVEDQATWELRRAVLRPHQDVEPTVESDQKSAPGGVAFAALDDEGTVVGTVRVAPDTPPLPLAVAGEPGRTWRLRGMAVRPDLRNRGLGGRLVACAVEHVEGQGASMLWCNARVPAIGLYRRAGFVIEGEPWEEPDIGPHVVMWRTLGR